jgi:hypothetical protein
MSIGFRDLVVWQKSMQLAVSVYELTKQFPREELYGLTSQVRRSAVSIPSNIAEGQGPGDPAMIDAAQQLSDEVRKMLYGLYSSLDSKSRQAGTAN